MDSAQATPNTGRSARGVVRGWELRLLPARGEGAGGDSCATATACPGQRASGGCRGRGCLGAAGRRRVAGD